MNSTNSLEKRICRKIQIWQCFSFETAVNFEQSCENASSILSHVISSWAQSELPRKRWDMALLKLRCTYFLKVDIT